MVTHSVHAVVMTARNGHRPAAIVSDLDLVAAVAAGARCSVSEIAATKTLTVSADAPLLNAARLMSDHRASHLVLVDGAGGYPVGVLSSLDLAAVYAED